MDKTKCDSDSKSRNNKKPRAPYVKLRMNDVIRVATWSKIAPSGCKKDKKGKSEKPSKEAQRLAQIHPALRHLSSKKNRTDVCPHEIVYVDPPTPSSGGSTPTRSESSDGALPYTPSSSESLLMNPPPRISVTGIRPTRTLQSDEEGTKTTPPLVDYLTSQSSRSIPRS